MDAQCKKCRREGTKLFLKGERCFGPKCSFTRRSYGPGDQGQKRRRRLSEYGTQLREKQKTKSTYGVGEQQFRRYYERINQGEQKQTLLSLIERRLDNVVYRLGFAPSRTSARQLTSHGHIIVNGKYLNIPSYQVRVGDVVGFKNTKHPALEDIDQNRKRLTPVSWISYDAKKKTGAITSLPTAVDMAGDISERLIVEYYSR